LWPCRSWAREHHRIQTRSREWNSWRENSKRSALPPTTHVCKVRGRELSFLAIRRPNLTWTVCTYGMIIGEITSCQVGCVHLWWDHDFIFYYINNNELKQVHVIRSRNKSQADKFTR
jgi:hypothetical protein